MTSWVTDLSAWIYSQVHLDDDSVLSVVTYAVDYLKVKHGRFTLLSHIQSGTDMITFSSDRRRAF